MRTGLRVMGAMAMSLVAPHLVSAQSSIAPPPPGTPVAPFNVPAHVLPQGAPQTAVDRGDKPAGRKIINTTNAQIEYRVDGVGPSGIGRVDVYLTGDRGATWVKTGEDTDKQSPANVNLPGEGLFGIRLAIVNGNGFGGKAPRPGDRPQFYVEVDAASPNVALLPVEVAANLGAIDIRWTASDPNLTAEPVSIFVRGQHSATWQPLAQNVKNDGSYRWVLPPNVPPQIFMKIEVVDLAGNVTKVESPSPILLDQTEPEATVIDATPINRSSPSNLVPVSMPTPQPPAALPPPVMPSTLPALPPGPIVPRQ